MRKIVKFGYSVNADEFCIIKHLTLL